MMVLFCFGQLPAFPVTGMASDGPPGHFVQGFWSPVWWQCFGDRRHKCSSTEFASARRTVNSFIICQKPWTKEFWIVFFYHRWGQIFLHGTFSKSKDCGVCSSWLPFCQAGRHGNNPWLSGPWCLTLVPTHLDLDHPLFIVYQLINCPIEDAEFHARFDYQRKRFFFRLPWLNDIVFFWYWLIPDNIELISCFLGQVGGEKPQQKNLGYTNIHI